MPSPTGGTPTFERRGPQSHEALGPRAGEFDTKSTAVGAEVWRTVREASGAAQNAQYSSYSAELFKKFCFAAGTPLLTPTGHKNIEDFHVGDELLAAADNDARSVVGVQVVEEVFSNHSPIVNLHVAGKIIRTTAEHPVFAWGKGWVPAASLVRGDRLRSHDGQVVVVEGVAYSGEEADVYNLRVSQWHTYFVGAAGWGFSVWSHNASADECSEGAEVDEQIVGDDSDASRALLAAKGQDAMAEDLINGKGDTGIPDGKPDTAVFGTAREDTQDHHAIPHENSQYKHHEHPLVEAAGADLTTDKRNIGPVVNHVSQGHSAAYHDEVRDRMDNAWEEVRGQGPAAADEALGKVMDSIWRDIANGSLKPYDDRDVWLDPDFDGIEKYL